MSAIPQIDYIGRVREEIGTLEAELSERGVRDELSRLVTRLELPEDLGTAAIFRAARRSGLGLRMMLTELQAQLDRAERPGG